MMSTGKFEISQKKPSKKKRKKIPKLNRYTVVRNASDKIFDELSFNKTSVSVLKPFLSLKHSNSTNINLSAQDLSQELKRASTKLQTYHQQKGQH